MEIYELFGKVDEKTWTFNSDIRHSKNIIQSSSELQDVGPYMI